MVVLERSFCCLTSCDISHVSWRPRAGANEGKERLGWYEGSVLYGKTEGG